MHKLNCLNLNIIDPKPIVLVLILLLFLFSLTSETPKCPQKELKQVQTDTTWYNMVPIGLFKRSLGLSIGKT